MANVGPVTAETPWEDPQWRSRRSAIQGAVADRVAAAGSPELARDALVAETRALIAALEAVTPTLAEADALAVALRWAREFVDAAAESQSDIEPWAELWTVQGLLDALRVAADRAGVSTRAMAETAAVRVTAYDATTVIVDGAAVAARTLALATMPDTVAMETTLARLPLWAESRQVVAQLTLWATGSLYGHPVRIVQGAGPMDDRAYRLLAHLVRSYALAECPPERRVSFTLSEAARWAGYGKGGRQLRLVRDSLLRMRATALESAVRYPDGHTESLAWGLIDRGWTTDAVGRSGGFVTLSEELAGLIRQGSLVYLDAPTLDALGERDGMAVILWGFLEGESRPSPWRYSLFSAPEGYPPVDSRDVLAIADLLRVSGWERRRRAKDRIGKAAAAIMAIDPRYQLVISRGQGRGMWTLNVARGPGTPRGARRVLSGALAGTPGGASGYSPGRGRTQNGGVTSVLSSGSNVGSLTSAIQDVDVDTRATGSPRENRAKDRVNARHRAAILEAERQGRPDVATLLERTGWTRPTAKVAKLLDDLAARHDVTGYAWAADRIREAPITSARPGDDVLQYLLEADAAWRAPRLEAADAEDRAAKARHRAAKARPRSEDPPALVGDVLPSAAALPPELVPLRPLVAPPPDAATLERRRAQAIDLLRAGGESETVAARLMADYGISPDELA